jgi:small subunit ribosomal protein S18
MMKREKKVVKNGRDKMSWGRTGMRKKTCPFEDGVLKIDYKDPRTLQKFVSERGKVMPRRISMVSAKKQKVLSLAVKRARFLALLPYVAN